MATRSFLVYNGFMLFSKRKTEKRQRKASPLPSLAKDFQKMDSEEPICAKKNDGTD